MIPTSQAPCYLYLCHVVCHVTNVTCHINRDVSFNGHAKWDKDHMIRVLPDHAEKIMLEVRNQPKFGFN